MKVAIVYDSIFGNTGKVAAAIAEALRAGNDVTLLTVQEARNADLSATDLLIVGSPTRGFRPTLMISDYIEGLTAGPGNAAASFDTRIETETLHPAPLRWVVEAGGYAAERIAASLRQHGFTLRGEGAGFTVTGTEGPLKEHELERAKAWALSLAA